MNKLLAAAATVGCSVLLLQGCGRHSSPTAPAQVTAPQTTTTKAIHAIEVGGGAVDEPMAVGQTMQLRAVAQLVDGTEQDVTDLATWTSTNPAVATVTSGLVTANGAGLGRIRAAYGSATGETVFNVVERAGGPGPNGGSDASTTGGSSDGGSGTSGSGGSRNGGTPTVQSLTITGDHNVPVGRTAQLRAIAHMSDGSERDVTSSANWRSNDTIIGTITQGGLFTGLTPGPNGVNAEYGGASASQPIQVTPF